MCEEYDPRRCTPPCNQATKCVGKKGAEAEDEACHQTPKCSRYMDNCHENLRCKRNDIRSLFWQNIPKLSKAPYTSLLGYALLYSFLGGKKRKGHLRLTNQPTVSNQHYILPLSYKFPMLFDGAAPIDDDCKVDKMMRNKLHSASKVGETSILFPLYNHQM